jgi:hypothetical protein
MRSLLVEPARTVRQAFSSAGRVPIQQTQPVCILSELAMREKVYPSTEVGRPKMLTIHNKTQHVRETPFGIRRSEYRLQAGLFWFVVPAPSRVPSGGLFLARSSALRADEK